MKSDPPREMTSYKIPFNRPSIVGQEIAYVSEAIRGGHISGDGGFTKRCHGLLEQSLGVGRALLTTSCTHALEMTALLLDVKEGDEVILPSFTFVSTANAFVLRGAVPVFVDIRPDTLNLDEALLERAITPRTKAVVVVHYAGVACEMDAIREIADRHAIAVIEDAAHALFGKYRGRHLGTFGELATLSFHETKNFSCGEGGALLINDSRYNRRAEIIREKGTDRSRFFRGEVDKYTWIDLGSSYLPSDLLAGFLLGQLEQREEILQRRRAVWDFYSQRLAHWAGASSVQLPVVPAHCEQPYHMFHLIYPSSTACREALEQLKARSILAVTHYQPLHLSVMGRRFGGKPGDCPVTESVCDRLLRLPLYATLRREDQAEVIAALTGSEGAR